MTRLNRREFLAGSAIGATGLTGAERARSRVGLVHSTHRRLVHPASPEDPLDYAKVRDMVWKAIEYGKPRAGSLEAAIRPGSWVVIKPNIVFLRPQQGYNAGDITDWRVTKAVVEYVASRSKAGRISIAEGGSYRGRNDPAADEIVEQDGRRVDAYTFDWGHEEYPGFAGSMEQMLGDFRREFPGKRFDYIDLTHDGVRDESGRFKRIEVPRTKSGIGAFAPRPDYFVSRTIVNSDFLISVPVMKVHEQCGITGCFKNYVGTAPRGAYGTGAGFWNQGLHTQHSLDNRIDPFIADLASFHPPDYCVVSGIRGNQYHEHDTGREDQIVRGNLILAGEDPVATDTVIARLLGFNPHDIDFLHMTAKRGIGTMDLRAIDVAGDELDRFEARWGKPRNWYGRCNREWRLTAQPDSDQRSWRRFESRTDTLDLPSLLGPVQSYSAAVRVFADSRKKAFLWTGARGHVTAALNGERVLDEQAMTRYRIGQFQRPVELKEGENLLVFRIEPLAGQALLSALLVTARNDGDSIEGIRWMA